MDVDTGAAGMRSTVGKPSPGPALRLTVVVTMPGAAVRRSHQQHGAADKQSSQFHGEFLLVSWNAVAKQTFPEEWSR